MIVIGEITFRHVSPVLCNIGKLQRHGETHFCRGAVIYLILRFARDPGLRRKPLAIPVEEGLIVLSDTTGGRVILIAVINF